MRSSEFLGNVVIKTSEHDLHGKNMMNLLESISGLDQVSFCGRELQYVSWNMPCAAQSNQVIHQEGSLSDKPILVSCIVQGHRSSSTLYHPLSPSSLASVGILAYVFLFFSAMRVETGLLFGQEPREQNGGGRNRTRSASLRCSPHERPSSFSLRS